MNEYIKKAVLAVSDLKDEINEVQRKNSIISRLNAVIKFERASAEKEYAALGRYYYEKLRDRDNAETESHCAELDETLKRIVSAEEHLSRMNDK